jgi:hypothetical protein
VFELEQNEHHSLDRNRSAVVVGVVVVVAVAAAVVVAVVAVVVVVVVVVVLLVVECFAVDRDIAPVCRIWRVHRVPLRTIPG